MIIANDYKNCSYNKSQTLTIDFIEYFSWKDLLPILLEVLEEEKYINHMNNEVSGSKYKSIIVNNICNSEWNTEIMPSLATMFR